MGAQRDLGQTLYVPITLHSIGSKGAGFANGYDLFKSICALNDYFKAANIQFSVGETFNFMMMNRCMVLKVDFTLKS
ncbi:MAG: hypothetical protein IPO64_16070 [Bacteroidetes bacterium]|nr:hypothetical protein [Bacteroidota bacterium]